MKKLAIVSTHPIQYYAPIFKLLHQRNNISIKVFYTLGNQEAEKYDPGFNKVVSWDIPLLEAYPYEWANNIAENPDTRSFKGIITPGLASQIEKWQPDALLIFGWAYKSHLKLIRYFSKKIPVYFRGDSTILRDTGLLKGLLKSAFLNWIYSHVDHAFYVGQNNKNYFLKYGLKQNQLSFAPHAIDNARFSESRKEEAAELRSSLKLKEDDILILFAGKFEPIKNVDLLLQAFINLNRQNVHLLLVGNGVNENELRNHAVQSTLAENIHFLDFKNQSYMPVLYQAADLFCLPSKSETWGLSINEAMACGKAILASDKVGCAIDLIQKDKNGAIFIEGDVNSLTECLKHLTADKHLLASLGNNSRNMIKDWTFEHVAAAIEAKLLNG
ncbi:glycosyltransferase family 4 protein [Mucilaginibacter sp.]|uniref:glycosyltransferase family 4 protein n=1 Tax=Mucilaginibacter sp. TaxID=1882438 RepID=UPI003D0AA5F5